MRPLYVLLLAGTDHPQASGFWPPPSSFISPPLPQGPQQARFGEGPLEPVRSTPVKRSRRVRQRSTRSSSSSSNSNTAAGCWRQTHRDTTRACATRVTGWRPSGNQRSEWAEPSASRAWEVEHVRWSSSCSGLGSGSTSTSSSSSSSSSGRRTSSIGATAASSTSSGGAVALGSAAEVTRASSPSSGREAAKEDDPTAAAHGYLADFLGMTEEELQQLAAKYRSLPPGRRGPDEITVAGPELAAAATEAAEVAATATPAIASMLHVQLGVPKERVKSLLLKWPRLLEVSGSNAGQCLQWLTDAVGMTREEVAKLFLAHPPIARKAVCTCPQLLVKSVTSNFFPKTEFFEEALGVGRTGVGRMLVRYPQLFNFSLENMKWKARWLEQELMLDPPQVKRVLSRCPSVFAYSAERNLVPTLEFFLDELGATKRQVRRAVSKQPRLLGMSLENRLVPRLQQIRKAGVTPSWELHHEA
ncbi:unnamed protein product, partial [Scytosiphon promiscuus]